MTPIPTTVVQQIFPMDEMETEKEMEEEGVSRETARNVALLAEWDDDFDSIVDDFDEDANDADAGSSARRPHHKQRGRKRTPFKLSGGRRRSSSSRPEKSRRESSIFSRERKSLLDDSEDDSNGGLPFSVTIDPGEYTSPSSSSLSIPSDISTNTNDDVDISISTIGATPAKDIMLNNSRDSLDSTTSAYVSPSSLKSFATSIGGFESNSSSTGKETPNSARTSSSTILRAVHASGALLPSNSPQAGSAGGLRPNQLKYSPSNSTGRSVSDEIILLWNYFNLSE